MGVSFRRPEYLPILRHQAQNQYLLHTPGESWGKHGQVTAERVKSYFSKRVEGDCERFDLPGWCLRSVKLLWFYANVNVVSGIGGMNFVMQARKFDFFGYTFCAEMRCFKLGCSWRRRDVFFTQWDLQALAVNVICWFWESTQMSLQSIAIFSWFLPGYSPSACDRSGIVYLEMHAALAPA